MMGNKEFEEKGVMYGLMMRMKNPLWVTGKAVLMNSSFCVMEGFI